MFGVILESIASVFNESSDSIGKFAFNRKLENVYTLGFLSLFWTIIFLAITVIFGAALKFSVESLPFFVPRAILEVIQMELTIHAIVKADRSTFGFIRLVTVPLLLLVDIGLHYSISIHQLIGIALILVTLIWLLKNGKLNKQGSLLVLLTAINATITLSLYKYDISHFNSVAAEQILIALIIMLYMLIRNPEKPWRYLIKPLTGTQALLAGLGGAIEGYAYSFAPASIILTAKRALSVFWSIIFGNRIFKEKQLGFKIIGLLIIVLALVLIA